MSRRLAALARLAPVALLSLPLCMPVLAATSIDTAAFTITHMYSSPPGEWNMGVLAQTPLTTSISLDTLNVQNVSAHDLTGVGETNGVLNEAVLRVDVKDGYRITRLSMHGLAYGEILAGQAPDAEPGLAYNLVSMGFTVGPPMVQNFSWDQERLNGLQPVAVGTGTLSLDGTFELSLAGHGFAQAWGSVGPQGSSDSYAQASLGNLQLNVEVSAVPEPHGWAMLLMGGGLLALRGYRNHGQTVILQHL